MYRNYTYILSLCVFVIFILAQCLFFVQEGTSALVLQLGEPVGEVRSPGLNVKLPFVQNAVTVDARINTFSVEKLAALNSDIKTFELDYLICWKITDPLLFITTLKSEGNATEKLKTMIVAQLRAAIGNKPLNEVAGSGRQQILQHVLEETNQRSIAYGVTIVDVSIKRTNMPNKQAIFAHMNAERKKMANEYRFSGESMSREIRSQAELDRDILLAEATKESIIIRGMAEAKAMSIFAAAINTSPELYEYLKLLDVYKKSLKQNTKIILSSDDPILKNFN